MLQVIIIRPGVLAESMSGYCSLIGGKRANYFLIIPDRECLMLNLGTKLMRLGMLELHKLHFRRIVLSDRFIIGLVQITNRGAGET